MYEKDSLQLQIAFFDKVPELKKREELYSMFLVETKNPHQRLKLQHGYLLSLAKTLETKKPTDSAQLTELRMNMLETANAIVAAIDQRDLLASIGI